MKGILFHISLHSSPMTRKRQDVVSTIFLVDTQHPPSKKLEKVSKCAILGLHVGHDKVHLQGVSVSTYSLLCITSSIPLSWVLLEEAALGRFMMLR